MDWNVRTSRMDYWIVRYPGPSLGTRRGSDCEYTFILISLAVCPIAINHVQFTHLLLLVLAET